MNAKHTPGPWTYKATAGDHDFAIYPEATGRDVALVRDFNEANARLIAEAPAMRELLARIDWLMGRVTWEMSDHNAIQEYWQATTASLARIDGDDQ